jgi:hypothetical protein
MIAELVTVTLWFFGASDKVALRKALTVDKAVQTGGYSKSVAQFRPCVWPNTCKKDEGKMELLLASKPITTCVWPNTCSLN